MSHRFNDIVTLVRGNVETPALVVQSVQQPNGEHLTVVSLDPAKASPLLSGSNVDAAIRRDFVTPLTGGKTFGWKERPVPPKGFGQAIAEAIAAQRPSAAELMDEVQGPVEGGDPESPHALVQPAASSEVPTEPES
jgi:hypothetical protein